MKGKLKKVLVAVVVFLLLATSTTGMIFSIISFREVTKIKGENKETKKEADKEEDAEDDEIVIGDIYEIVSTEAISDAYISGDDSKLNDEDKKTLEVATEILNEIITEDMSDYEKEEAIYTWICENIRCDQGGTVAVPEARGIYDRPYGVLQNKQAVCVGYATTFRLLTNMVGLDCLVMHDTSYTHSWNIVKLDDGCWYIVDCYYDESVNGPLYANFNMNDEMAFMSHDWDPSEYPVANGTEYNYMEMCKVEVDDYMEFIEAVAELYNNDERFGVFQIPIDEDESLEEIYYIAEGIMGRLCTDYSDAMLEVYNSSEEGSVLVVYNYVDYSDEMGFGGDYGDIDYEAIDEVLNEHFGDEIYWEDMYWEDMYWEDMYWEDEYWEDIVIEEEAIEVPTEVFE